MIHAEYRRFLQTLNSQAVSEGVRKIANLVLEHLDELAQLTTHQGQRVKQIVALTQAKWETIDVDIQQLPSDTKQQLSTISQLKSMSVGSFRGFARQEVFDLASRLVLIYGSQMVRVNRVFAKRWSMACLRMLQRQIVNDFVISSNI